MNYHRQGARGREEGQRTDRYLKSAGYKRGGRVDGDTHISINIGAGGPGAGKPGQTMSEEDKKRAFAAGLAAGAQAGVPPPMPPPGAAPGGAPGGLPGAGPPMPGMKRGGRVSKARTVVGPGVTLPKKTKNVTGKSPMGSVKGGASQAAKRTGPPINNKKAGGSVTHKAVGGAQGRVPPGLQRQLPDQANAAAVAARAAAMARRANPMIRPAAPSPTPQPAVTPTLTQSTPTLNQAAPNLPTVANPPVSPTQVPQTVNPMINQVAPTGTGGTQQQPINPMINQVAPEGLAALAAALGKRSRGGGVRQLSIRSGGSSSGPGRLAKTRNEARS